MASKKNSTKATKKASTTATTTNIGDGPKKKSTTKSPAKAGPRPCSSC